jgi:hypothetical protein
MKSLIRKIQYPSITCFVRGYTKKFCSRKLALVRDTPYLLYPDKVFIVKVYPKTIQMACHPDYFCYARTTRLSRLHKTYCILATAFARMRFAIANNKYYVVRITRLG